MGMVDLKRRKKYMIDGSDYNGTSQIPFWMFSRPASLSKVVTFIIRPSNFEVRYGTGFLSVYFDVPCNSLNDRWTCGAIRKDSFYDLNNTFIKLGSSTSCGYCEIHPIYQLFLIKPDETCNSCFCFA